MNQPTAEDRVISQWIAGLRARLRHFVAWEGICQLITWVFFCFWIALAVDYLPVGFGFPESSRGVRIAILVFVAATSLGIAFRQVFSRLLTPLSDFDLALLVERHYPVFKASLLTSVRPPAKGTEEGLAHELWTATRSHALRWLPSVVIPRLLNYRRLRMWIWIAAGMAFSLGSLAVANPSLMGRAWLRLVRLSNQPWPRQTCLVWQGIRESHSLTRPGILELGQVRGPIGGRLQVARGATLTLLVESLSQSPEGRELLLPNDCLMTYRLAGGGRGRATLKKAGRPQSGRQRFTFDGPPLENLTESLEFSLYAGDFAATGMKIEVVDPPRLASVELICQFPKYLSDLQSLRWTDRILNWTPGLALPKGTTFELRLRADRSLKKLYLIDPESQEVSLPSIESDTVNFSVPQFRSDRKWEIVLVDHMGVMSPEVYPIAIRATSDQPPRVMATLQGIGSAITSHAILPISASIVDDFQLKSAWISASPPGGTPWRHEFEVDSTGAAEPVLDLRELRQRTESPLVLEPGTQLHVSVQAVDHFDLELPPRVGQSDVYQLDIVTPNQLLRLLEKAEAAERRRLEQISRELGEARDFLVRAAAISPAAETASRPQSPSSPPPANLLSADLSQTGELSSPAPVEAPQLETRMVFLQRAGVQIEKVAQEIAGAALTFEQLRMQLVNNRLDALDREVRLKTGIREPLQDISRELLDTTRPATLACLELLRTSSQKGNPSDPGSPEQDPFQTAIQSCDTQWVRLNQIIGSLLKFETQNELLELVRQMIDEQQNLLQRTRQERQQRTFEGLLDD